MFEEFEPWLKNFDKSAPDVSNWSVGKHMDHCIKAANGITNILEASEPGARKPTFSFIKFFVFTFGNIPRGKGKSLIMFCLLNWLHSKSLNVGLQRVKILKKDFMFFTRTYGLNIMCLEF